MVIKQIEVSRAFNCGNYESERISLTAELEEKDSLFDEYATLHGELEFLHRQGPYKGAGLRRKG